jgi:hypothetical protein
MKISKYVLCTPMLVPTTIDVVTQTTHNIEIP